MATMMMRCRSVAPRCSSRRILHRFFSTQHYNVIISGGGVAGLTMAKVLQEQCPRYTVAVLDQGSTSGHDWFPSTVPHPRSYALSPKSLSILGEDVVCSQPEEQHQQQQQQQQPLRRGDYSSMQIWEANSPAMLVFSNHDVDGNSILGSCVEDAALTAALHQKLRPNTVWTNTKLVDFVVVRQADHQNNHNKKVQLITASCTPNTNANAASDQTSKNTETTFTTDLLIAADGAQSPIRTKLGLGWKGIDYGRTAITFTVELANPTNNKPRAYQRFLPHGPIALLPTYSDRHAVIVWSTTPQEAARLKSLDATELVKELNNTLQQGPQRLAPLLEREGKTDLVSSVLYGMERVLDTVHYGMGMRHWSDDPETFVSPPFIATVPTESPRFTFPLTCKLASQYTHAGQVALIGDAAHTVHPMAGQGLNIGLDDVAALAQAIRKSHDSGMEVGQFLQDYEQNRQWSVPQKVGGIHLLHSLFGMRSAPIMHGKSIGMSVINQLGPVRRQLAKIATGLD